MVVEVVFMRKTRPRQKNQEYTVCCGRDRFVNRAAIRAGDYRRRRECRTEEQKPWFAALGRWRRDWKRSGWVGEKGGASEPRPWDMGALGGAARVLFSVAGSGLAWDSAPLDIKMQTPAGLGGRLDTRKTSLTATCAW